MERFNNIDKILKDDLQKQIKKGSKLSIATACFSIYAYQELRNQLENIEQLRFIFTSPTFISDKVPKTKREFYIPRLNRERSLYRNKFEVKLRNELIQRVIAKECVKWIKQKVIFRSNVTDENIGGFINIENIDNSFTYIPVNGFTAVDIGCERGNNSYSIINRFEAPDSNDYISLFNQVWNDKDKLQEVTDLVIESITTAYKENSPDFIYFITLYNIFNEFLETVNEDEMPNEDTGFKESKIWNMLYNFQKDAALSIINRLEKYNGCILADSVGLGKTFTALAVIKYYENKNKSVLVLCPKKLSDNWNTYKGNYLNNPIASDRLRYDVLYHTDLSRSRGASNGIDLNRINWGNYDLVVIDESHNFRNGGQLAPNEKENRYLKLLNRVIRGGVKTRVLMLSATPVNNRFIDLKHQLALAYEGNPNLINEKLNTKKSIDEIFRNAQGAFNIWNKLKKEEQTTDKLLSLLDFDFFEMLDSVTIARSRKHIQRYYNTHDIGKFPTRLKPISYRPCLTDLNKSISYNRIYKSLTSLSLAIYTPSNYIFPNKMEKYSTRNKDNRLTQAGREQGIKRLMSINLLKRLESSVYSFYQTLKRIRKLMQSTINNIESYNICNDTLNVIDINELDYDDQNMEILSVNKKLEIDIEDIDYKRWKRELVNDIKILDELCYMVSSITYEHDTKLQTLLKAIEKKFNSPINENNKKIIIFTAFTDTAEYLYNYISTFAKQNYNLNTAIVTGSIEGKTTIPKLHRDLNTVLTCFCPIAKNKKQIMPDNTDEIDILIATDCISEGQNLQDCDYLINYDIHWNPVKIIQRFGRIDRIGSPNKFIQLVNFWPDLDLDEYINLKSRVETRMKLSIMTSTGDDNPINDEEEGDLDYRKEQLKRLQEEVVDIEDMTSGISIMDLGLNEFRLDLLEYVKQNLDIENTPYGLHAIVESNRECPSGVIFVLHNVNNKINIDNRNRIHPFYMLYISDTGNVVCNHLSPKDTLDKMRYLCKGITQPYKSLCKIFNEETKDGEDMSKYSQLLSEAIASIVDIKEKKDIDSLFSSGGTTALISDITGLDDFELICFLVIK